VQHTIEIAENMKYKAIFIYGYPEIYSKYGFIQSKQFNITDSKGRYPASLQVYELYPDALKNIKGIFDEGEAYKVDLSN
jgi:predicted N-acetyltransferase YhbS